MTREQNRRVIGKTMGEFVLIVVGFRIGEIGNSRRLTWKTCAPIFGATP